MRRPRFVRKDGAAEDRAETPAAGHSPQRMWRVVLGFGLAGPWLSRRQDESRGRCSPIVIRTWEYIRQSGVWRVGMDRVFRRSRTWMG